MQQTHGKFAIAQAFCIVLHCVVLHCTVWYCIIVLKPGGRRCKQKQKGAAVHAATAEEVATSATPSPGDVPVTDVIRRPSSFRHLQ